MKAYDIYLFDADGTLFDFDRAEANALAVVFTRRGFAYTPDILRTYRTINRQAWALLEKGELSRDELQTLRFSRLSEAAGLSFDARAVNDEYLFELGKGAFLMDGALALCQTLTALGKPIYIVTNGLLATQKARIEFSVVKPYIADFFVSEAVGFAKPHSAYFDYVFAHIPPVSREKVLIIGDSLTADIDGGNRAGIDSCWFNPAKAPNTTGIIPTYEIDSLCAIVPECADS